ncbi:signal peptidase I [Sinomonas sp. P47F7]|uniref:signal peptidase I n=1 Tax=Sinomonas sp. P47F7 TaxID=3410987 RepID=UPI003BF4A5BC
MTNTLDPAAPAPVVRAGRRGRALTWAGQILTRVVLGLVLSVAVAAFLFLGVGPRFLGYQTSTMLTGSMAPLINPGDVVVSVKVPASALKVGDIITYQIPVQDQRVETHRIVSLTRNSAGATIVTTKGDANNGSDPWTAVITDSAVYTEAAVIPHLGDVIRTLRSPIVRSILVFGAPTILVTLLLVSIWRRPSESPDAGAPGAESRTSAHERGNAGEH